MEQECSDTIPSDTVLGASGGLHHDDHLHPEQQVEGDSPVMPGDKQEEPHLSPRTRQVDRQDDSNSNGSSACSSILQKSTTVEEQSPDHLGVLRRHSSPYSKCEGGVRMVGSGATEWNGRPIHPRPPDLTIETDASLLGWGAIADGVSTGGLWSETERKQHQLPGDAGSSYGSPELCKELEGQTHTTEDGQPSNDLLC